MTEPPFLPADLAADTRVTPLDKAPGWYTAELNECWDFMTPSGGVLMTVALRAMQDLLADDGLRPISANTVFLSQVPSGPMEVRVELLRRGGAAAQLRAALSSTAIPGPGLEVTATFARHREGPDFTDAEAPDLSSAKDASHVRWRTEPPRMFANLDVLYAADDDWFDDDFEPGPARVERWWRYRVPQRLPDGRLDPLALPPIADTMPPAVRAYMGPDFEFFAPSLDLTVHFLADTTAEWLGTRVYARRAARGYATAEVEIWGDGSLIAYSTQTMLIRKEDPLLAPPAGPPGSPDT